MNKLKLLTFILLTNSAFSCPDLQGTYQCESENNVSWSLTITQSLDSEGHTLFQFGDSNVLTADNIWKPSGLASKFRNYCLEDKSWVLENIFDLEDYYGHSVRTYSLTEDGFTISALKETQLDGEVTLKNTFTNCRRN